MAVRFTTLGRVALLIDAVEVAVPGRRERTVLALLLSAHRRVLSVDRLIEEIWHEGAADSAHGSLQVAISRLRALIEPDREPRAEPQLLVRTGSGYALLARTGTTDGEQFSSLIEQAHVLMTTGDGATGDTAVDDAEQTVALCEEALRLWVGPPFGDALEGDLLRSETARLEELRVTAVELRAEALLALGRHALQVGELEAMVASHPWRERPQELYALALYRTGRQKDALASLRHARETMVAELGVDPSPALRQLEADILVHEPHLAAPAAVGRPLSDSETGGWDERRSDLVGRREALSLLESMQRRSLQGRGQIVLVSGEAGIGKSRLISELAATAGARGVDLVWGRCPDADVAPPFWPWLPLIRALADERPSPLVTEVIAPTGTPSRDVESAALRVLDALCDVIGAACSDRPLLVLLEDIQWADPSSLRLLSFAAQALLGSRILIVATVRDTPDPGPALVACLAELGRRSAPRIALAGLSTEEVASLIQRAGGPADDDDFAAVVAARTDGNPFFVLELVRLLAAEGRLDPTGAREVHIPHGVQDVLRQRLSGLPPDLEHLLGSAAVVGREFDLELVSAVAGTDPERTLELIEQAVHHVVVAEGSGPGRFRFTHALVRETFSTALTTTRRNRTHARVALALEPRLALDSDLVGEVAHHFVLGATVVPELIEPAVRHSIAAAILAEGRHDLELALLHWEKARDTDQLAPVTDLARRYQVLLGVGLARARRADVFGSRRALDAAVAIGRVLGDLTRVAEAATSFSGAGVWNWREVGDSDPALIDLLNECIRTLPAGALRVRCLASLAMELTFQWRSAEADTAGLLAVVLARELGDDDLFAEVAALRCLSLWGRPGSAAERIALVEEVLTRPQTYEQELYTRFGSAPAYLQSGDADGADAQMARCLELARLLRHTGADVPIAFWRFYRALASEDTVLAERLLVEAFDRHRLSRLVSSPEVVSTVTITRAADGAPVSDEDVLLAAGHASPAFRALVARAVAESGRVEEAVALLGDPVPDGAWDYGSMFADCLRLDVLAHTIPGAELVRMLARIGPWGHEHAQYGSHVSVGSVDYFVGRGLEALGHRDSAALAYTRAVTANERAGLLPWQRRAEQRLTELAQ